MDLDTVNTVADNGGVIGVILMIAQFAKGILPRKLTDNDRYLPLIPLIISLIVVWLYLPHTGIIDFIKASLGNGFAAIGVFNGAKKLAGHSKHKQESTKPTKPKAKPRKSRKS
jgi:hypothetical protein